MKKKEQVISKNVSSGAEKVELIEKKVKEKSTKRHTPKVALEGVTLGSPDDGVKTYEKTIGQEKIIAKKSNAESSGSKGEKESERAKARVAAALKRKEAMEKKKEARAKKAQARAEKRAKKAAKRKALLAKRMAERKARQEKIAKEKEEKQRERAHAKANKKQQSARKKKNKKESRARREKGYGGWIAAVVSLGVVTLALATTVTVGAVEMTRATDSALASYKGTMYELTEIMENVDEDLDRLRISDSASQQSRILTDVLVQTRLAELDLEKLPLTALQDGNITAFINKTAALSERMLSKLRAGERLTDIDRLALERAYETTHAIRAELDALLSTMTDKDWTCCLKKGEGKMYDTMEKLDNATLEENRATFGALPKQEIFDKNDKKPLPYTNPTMQDGEGIQPARAEELCKGYFANYNVQDFQCIGETVGKCYTAYNVQGYDKNGTLLFAELDKKDGTLLRFDYYEDCKDEKYNLEQCEELAEEFLEKLGYDDMEVVRFSKNDGNVDFTFVYEEDDVVYYPMQIRVKVCGTRGIVSGIDVTKYHKNQGGRYEFNAKLTMEEAKEKLYKELSLESARPAVVATERGLRSSYEFLCGYEGESYFVYIDGETGEEIAIVNAKTAW